MTPEAHAAVAHVLNPANQADPMSVIPTARQRHWNFGSTTHGADAWTCRCGWWGSHGWMGYSVHLEAVLDGQDRTPEVIMIDREATKDDAALVLRGYTDGRGGMPPQTVDPWYTAGHNAGYASFRRAGA